MLDSKWFKQINEEYQKELEGYVEKSPNPMEQMKEVHEQMIKAKFTLKGKPFPTFLKPLLVKKEDRKLFEEATYHIMNAIEKVAELFFKSEEYHHLFEMNKIEKELAMINPRYPRRVIIGRLDAFYSEEGLKFLEFNCDSPSGMGWHDELVKIFSNTPVIKSFSKKYNIHFDTFLDNLYKTFITKYQEFDKKNKVSNPTIAVICNENSSIRNDVDLIIKHFNEKIKHKTIFADPRDGEYDGKSFKMRGEEIEIIYRDAIQDFTDYWNEVQGTIQAYKDGKVCLINPFCSRVGGLKCVLWIMSDEKYSYLFTDKEKEIINKHIPWTRLMKEGKTEFKNQTIDLFEYVRKNKEQFVLKPNAGFGGFEVKIGKEVSQEEWEKAIENASKSPWVVQEVLNIPKDKYPEIDENSMKFEEKNVNINFFAFNGKFSGGFVRVSSSSIINVHQGGGLIPIAYIS